MKKVLYCLFACALFLLGVVNVYGDDRVLLTVTIQGDGQITSGYEAEELYFSEKHPIQKITEKTPVGTKILVSAKANKGFVFVKWILDGEDYSTDKQVTIAVTKNMNLIAVFAEGREPNIKTVKEPSEDNLLLYIGLGTIVVLLVAIGAVLAKRRNSVK